MNTIKQIKEWRAACKRQDLVNVSGGVIHELCDRILAQHAEIKRLRQRIETLKMLDRNR